MASIRGQIALHKVYYNEIVREQSLNNMNEWRLRYCLIAPVAGIVTEELHLIERFFLPVKRIVKEGF
ncbi:hypothetical protein [uncultured Parabacteroides sp.]|uniref:hypothetical protein n=1 Tax=uncultured Parabacteroides sp. TaxID=512312 RepID=UPI0026197A16|nr:hypothetical protein [uncultured Parabacteroides sp.]